MNDAKITRFREAFFNPLRSQGKWQDGLIQLANKFADYLKTPDAQEFSDKSLKTITGNSQSGDDLLWNIIVVIIVVGLIVYGILREIFGRGGSGGSSGGWTSGTSGSSSGGSSSGGGGGFGGGGTGG